MKNILYAIVALLASFTLQIKAESFVKSNHDSIPPPFVALKQYHNDSEKYLAVWNQMKQEIDAKQGDKTLDLYFLYRDKNDFYYETNNVDSLKIYTPIFQKLALELGDEYHYYRSWDLLCEAMLFTNAMEEETAEHLKMHNDALNRKSKIGMAYSTNRIGMVYATRKEYAKAQPYIQQSVQLFKKMKYWNEYITLTANYIIILINEKKQEEALNTFMQLDSLANSFIKEDKIRKNANRILMIKDMASEIYSAPKDSVILKKYMEEMEDIYRKAPGTTNRDYLYNTKTKYAILKNNLAEATAYQDSLVQYYLQNNNIVNLKSIYHSMAINLYQSHRYKEAYEALFKYASLNDSIYKEDFQRQINEMSTRYNMNRLELDAQKEHMKARNMQYYYACALIAILIVTLFIGIRFYLHKLKSNRLLQQQAQALIHANEKVQQAQLMKTAFIQNMNHEVRTPLNAIVGFSECLAEIPMGAEDTKEVCSTIKQNSDKLLKIISDMLSIANIDSDESEPVYQNISLDALCSDLIQEMQEQVQPGVSLHYSPSEADCTLISDMNIVHQILANLLHNAAKFTQKGEIELSYQSDSKRKKLFFCVRDTGPGVKSELKEKIFERFYKVNSFIPGTGLGLALCRVLAERLGAQVYLDDSYQKGCLFVFAHPLK